MLSRSTRTADLSQHKWRKARHSGTGDNCVEVAGAGQVVAVRDSKKPDAGRLAFSPHEWHAFAERVKNGGYDLS
jgi:hypothetical protein